MADLRPLLADLAAGRLSRRAFLHRAAALGLSAPLAALLARDPVAALAQATPGGGSAGSAGGQPGPAVDKLLFSAFNVDQAPLNIQHGDMDLYLFGLKTAAAKELEANGQGVRLIQSPATTISLILNPAPAPQGDFNPFSVPEVRQAMQYLVDRDFIASDIYQGHAVPMLSHVSPLDYDELTVFQTVHALNIRHDPELAKQQIAAAMQKAGAALGGDGKWAINGNPIVLKFIIRVEDERRDVGDLIRAALEGVGFTVQPAYQPFGPATLAVYTTDPITFGWHLYTEGWTRSAPERYDYAAINQYAAPWLGNMPGWQQAGYWEYQQPDLDKMGQQLYRGEFKSKDERNKTYQEMTALALKESVRVWLVTVLQSFAIRQDVKDVTEDLVGGPKSVFTLREAHIDGRNDIKVGNLWVWTERTTWNPVGGFSDAYSNDIYRNIVDAPIVNHPFTGLPQPFRAAFDVKTGGPGGTVPIPDTAVVWDAAGGAWKAVGGGATAVSKVTFDFTKYFQSTWHHGQPITMADVVYSIASGFDLAYNDKKVQIETALAVTSRPLLDTFKGFNLVDDTHLEVYVNYWHFEPSYIASYATPTGLSTPWELLAALDDLVFNKRQAAYSDTAAARFSVPWISLVQESDARLVLRTLRQFGREKTVPTGFLTINGKALATPEQAADRYKASEDWFNKTKLLVISNGPFFLARYDPSAQFAELDAFRDAHYPFKAGDFRFGAPPKLAIAPVQAPPATTGEAVSVPVTVSGPGTLALKYVLVDPSAGKVVAAGDAQPGSGGSFTVSLGADVTQNLFPSVYQLYLLASSDAISQVAEQRVDLEIGG